MIRVTIELFPHGNENKKLKIAQVDIANDGSGTDTRGNYWAKLYGRGSMRVIQTVEVKDFPRKRLHAMDLLYRVMKAARGDNNP